jgi:dTDP-4-amino-4,6-dideoxygalactose transaminase
MMGCNSRLDTLQAVVGNWILPQAKSISDKRIANAKYLDDGLKKIQEISIPPRPQDFRLVFHLYIVFSQDRDNLLQYCLHKGIDAKIHYPIPIYKQTALKDYMGQIQESFPVTDAHVEKIITFPCDQHLEKDQLDYIISSVTEFYER